MERSFFISGIGGQGIQLMGKALAYAANECDLNLCLYPYYAGQRRGGITFVRLTISDAHLGAPEKEHYDYVVLMDQYSYDSYAELKKPGGIVILNSDLVTEPAEDGIKDATVISHPFTSLAENSGNPRNFNLILAGFVGAVSKVVPNEMYKEELLKLTAKTEEQRAAYSAAFDSGAALAV